LYWSMTPPDPVVLYIAACSDPNLLSAFVVPLVWALQLVPSLEWRSYRWRPYENVFAGISPDTVECVGGTAGLRNPAGAVVMDNRAAGSHRENVVAGVAHTPLRALVVPLV